MYFNLDRFQARKDLFHLATNSSIICLHFISYSGMELAQQQNSIKVLRMGST
jgi:hypothetical protein